MANPSLEGQSTGPLAWADAPTVPLRRPVTGGTRATLDFSFAADAEQVAPRRPKVRRASRPGVAGQIPAAALVNAGYVGLARHARRDDEGE